MKDSQSAMTKAFLVAHIVGFCLLTISCDSDKAQSEVKSAEKSHAEKEAAASAAAAEEAKAKEEAEKAEAEVLRLKAEAEAQKLAAALEEKRKTVEGVMAFLNGAEFMLGLKWQEGQGREIVDGKEKHSYSNFSYDEQREELGFQLIRFFTTESRNYPQIGSANSYLFNFRIQLSSASAVVEISDYKAVGFKGETQPRGKQVSIRAKSSYRLLEKKGESQATGQVASLQRSASALMTTADQENLATKDWTDEEAQIPFVVSEELAPRLKAALEDLLKAHGVVVSKY